MSEQLKLLEIPDPVDYKAELEGTIRMFIDTYYNTGREEIFQWHELMCHLKRRLDELEKEK